MMFILVPDVVYAIQIRYVLDSICLATPCHCLQLNETKHTNYNNYTISLKFHTRDISSKGVNHLDQINLLLINPHSQNANFLRVLKLFRWIFFQYIYFKKCNTLSRYVKLISLISIFLEKIREELTPSAGSFM